MRLIDADLMMESLGFENTKEEREENIGEIITWEDVDSQPTAFDVEKVVEQLKEESRQSYADFEKYAEEHNMGSGFNDWHYKGLNRAIEIVKRGRRDEE